MTAMPELKYARGPCPQCGARTAKQAESACTATQQMSGDYECAGSDCKEDSHGFFRFPTQASLAKLDRWYDEQGMRDNITSSEQK